MRKTVRFLIWVAFAAAIVGAGTIARGLANAVADPVRRETDITIAGIDPAKPPIRLALLSDIHIGNRGMTAQRLNRIVAQVNAGKPDLVILAGDFVNGHDPGDPDARPAEFVAPLRGLHAPLGVYATLGNHDNWTGAPAVTAALRQAGVIVLENEARRAGPLALIGIGDSYSGHADPDRAIIAGAAVGGVPVVVTHSPDIIRRLHARVPLVLAGHTHCHQVVLPLIGPLPRAVGYRLYDPHYGCGLIDDGSRKVVITGGLGTGGVPIRIGAPSDWWLIRLSGPKDPETPPESRH